MIQNFKYGNDEMILNQWVTIKSYEIYGLEHVEASYMINNFASIGWIDPIPKLLEITKKFLVRVKEITPEQI